LSLVIIILILSNKVKSNEVSKLNIYFGKSITQTNQQFENKIKTFGEYKLFSQANTAGFTYYFSFFEILRFSYGLSTYNNRNEVNGYLSSFHLSSMYAGLTYDFIESEKFDLNISTYFGFGVESYKFKNTNGGISNLNSLFNRNTENTINMFSANYKIAAEFVYFIYDNLGLAVSADYSGQLTESDYFFDNQNNKLSDLDAFRTNYISLQIGLCFKVDW
jgi:hypothetical protein